MTAPGTDLLVGWAPRDPAGAGGHPRLGALAGEREPVLVGGCEVLAPAHRSPAGEGAQVLVSGRLVGGAGAEQAASRYAATGDAAAALGPLRGEFVAVLWHPRNREVVVARDQLGGRGVHYRVAREGLAFAEEIRDLLPLLEVTPGPDPRAVGLLLMRGLLPPGRTPYEGVERLGPGRLLRWRGGSASVERWWRPRYAGVRDGTPAELADRTVHAMDRAVARTAAPGQVGIMLSGGLDSAAVAAGAVRWGGRSRPVGYSGVFPGDADMDETEKLDAVVKTLGLRSVRRVITGGSAVGGSLAYLEEWKLPAASPNHFAWQPLFARAAADGVSVMLDGEGGDEVFDVSAYAVADALRRGRVRHSVELARTADGAGARALRRALRSYGLKGAAPHAVHRLLARRPRAAPRWLRAEVAARAEADYDRWAWKRERGPLWWRHQAYLLTGVRELLDAHGYVRRRAWEVGLDSRHPFLHDVELVETVLTIPPEPRFHPRLDRILLRRGLEGRLPDSVRTVQDKRTFDGLLRLAMDGGDAALIRELVEEPRAEVRAFLEPGALGDDVTTLWRVGMVECWLRSLADPGFPARLAERCPAPPARFEVVPPPG